MGDMLSQAELDALLGGMMTDDDEGADVPDSESPADEMSLDDLFADEIAEDNALNNNDDDIADEINEDEVIGSNTAPIVPGITSVDRASEVFSPDQCDALGEIGNISMGTASTTLYALLNQKVTITTPKVTVLDWKALSSSYSRPCVGIRVDYRTGLKGSNILILKDRDVKIIADLMMGGTGEVSEPIELNDIDMSAIGEAMNQMVGSSATSLSSMIKEKVDIKTPIPFMLEFQKDDFLDTIEFEPDDLIACVSFRMEIGTLIDSEIMQILPIEFAKNMVIKLQGDMLGEDDDVATESPPPAAVQQPPPQAAPAPEQFNVPPQSVGYGQPPQGGHAMNFPPPQAVAQNPAAPPQNVQAVSFQPLDYNSVFQQKENMGIIMDVPLDITVELGRTHKKIQEILEFSPGTIITLDRMAGEPIDILVNGKFVAKGEVVVIDENFGIRITEIVSVEKRI